MTSFAANTPQIGPAGYFLAVSKSDSATYTGVRGVYVGATGDVVVRNIDGTSVTFTAVPAGTTLPISPSVIMSAGTSASGFVVFY